MIMRKLLLVGGAVLFGSSAFAADLAYKAPPPAYLSGDWSGFYIGVNGGGAWTDPELYELDSATSFDAAYSAGTSRASGGIVGGHFGYNWQYYNSIVAGFEIDADAAHLTSTASANYTSTSLSVTPGLATLTLEESVKSLATARGRVGWLAWNSFLLYGTGGLAWERVEDTVTGTLTGSSIAASSTAFMPTDRFGFVAGVGGEWALFSSHWLLRVEYLHYDFGKGASSNSSLSSSGSSTTSYLNDTVDVVRGGLSFKF